MLSIKPNNKIVSYENLNVYQTAYNSMLIIFKQILPNLPKEEQYDLKDQLRRSSKAIPRLIGEGYAKRHQVKGFQKYLDDAMAEANETKVSLCQSKDLYFQYLDKNLCESLIDSYDKIGRQLYKLALSWDNFNHRNRKTKVETGYVTVTD